MTDLPPEVFDDPDDDEVLEEPAGDYVEPVDASDETAQDSQEEVTDA